MTGRPTRVAVLLSGATDQVRVREALRNARQATFEIATFEDPRVLVDRERRKTFDAFILDFDWGRQRGGLDVLKEAARRGLEQNVVVFMASRDGKKERDALEAGACAVVVRRELTPELLELAIATPRDAEETTGATVPAASRSTVDGVVPEATMGGAEGDAGPTTISGMFQNPLVRELALAIDGGAIEPYYQTIHALADGTVVGTEALVRWTHPERGVLAPSEFVPMAERAGLIGPLGRAVLFRACEQTAAWNWTRPATAPLSVGVNVSGVQLASGRLVDDVEEALARSNLPPGCLRLELKGAVLGEHPLATRKTLPALAEMGVPVVVDDFGSGQLSLTQLAELPIGGLKIDRSVVDRLEQGSRYRKIIRCVLWVASEFEIPVIAEGIERATQLVALKELGCTYAQGYFFARPIPASAFGAGTASSAA